MTYRITEKQGKQIVEAYQSGELIVSIAKRFEFSGTAITSFLKRQNVFVPHANRKYAVDESYFEKIDTEAKAYWLGFISADGHVSDYGIQIRLGIKDKNHLEKFKKDIKSEHLIVDRLGQCNTPVVEINIGSKRLSKSLRKLGLESNKTFTIKFCEKVPKHLVRHYWRGFVDGDGWLNERKTDRKQGWEVGLCSASPELLESFHDFILDHAPNFKGKIARQKENLYRVRCNGVVITRLLVHLLYYGSSIYLDRKRESAQQIMELEENLTDYTFYDKETLEFLHSRANNNWGAVADLLGISITSNLTKIARERGIKIKGKSYFSTLSREDRIVYLKDILKKCDNNKREAASMLDFSVGRLNAVLLELGIDINRKLPDWLDFPRDLKIKEIQFALDSTKTKKEAANFLGVSLATLFNYRKELGMVSPKNTSQGLLF